MNISAVFLLILGVTVSARPSPQNIIPIVNQGAPSTPDTNLQDAHRYGNPEIATDFTDSQVQNTYIDALQPLSTIPINGLSSNIGSSGAGSSGAGKRGVAYNSESPSPNIFSGDIKVTWAHDWFSTSLNMLPDHFEFVPTLTDISSASLQVWDTNVQAALSKDSSSPKYLMSFNEPDYSGSLAFSGGLGNVDNAVVAYKQYMNRYGSDMVKLGSPSVTNGEQEGMGIAYLTNFLNSCVGCKIDFVPVHWYGCDPGPACSVDSDVQLFKSQISQAMEAAKGRPVWIPEFQHKGALSDQRAFLEQVLPWLDGESRIERYAYFMLQDGILTTAGRKNEVGMAYSS